MFLTLLLVTFGVSVLSCFFVVRLFQKPIERILDRIVADDISDAWIKYVKFAIYVVGISGGVKIWSFERYLNPQGPEMPALELTWERWTLDLYSTIIQTLQATAWMLLVFFVFALIAYVLVRIFGMKRGARMKSDDPS